MNKDKESKIKVNGGTKIIIVLLTIIVIVGTSFGIYYFLNKDTKQKVVIENSLEDEKTYSLGEFKLNLADENAERYIQATIFVGYKKNSKLEKEFEEKKQILRDAVTTVIRSKKAVDLSVKGTESMKTNLKEVINPVLQNGKIDNIYYDSIIIQ